MKLSNLIFSLSLLTLGVQPLQAGLMTKLGLWDAHQNRLVPNRTIACLGVFYGTLWLTLFVFDKYRGMLQNRAYEKSKLERAALDKAIDRALEHGDLNEFERFFEEDRKFDDHWPHIAPLMVRVFEQTILQNNAPIANLILKKYVFHNGISIYEQRKLQEFCTSAAQQQRTAIADMCLNTLKQKNPEHWKTDIESYIIYAKFFINDPARNKVMLDKAMLDFFVQRDFNTLGAALVNRCIRYADAAHWGLRNNPYIHAIEWLINNNYATIDDIEDDADDEVVQYLRKLYSYNHDGGF